MREILFKARRKDNGKWVYGYLFRTPLTADFDCDGQYFSSMVKRICISNEDGCVFEVIPETICEYTGLTDKNGVKIFENDLVKARYEENNGYIKWNSDNASFQVKGIPSHTLKRADELEVIGNVFDEGVENVEVN